MESSRPSDTARLIAQCTILASRDPGLSGLVPGKTVEVLKRVLEEDGRKDWIGPLSRFALSRWFLFRLERLLLPGIVAHYLVRKRAIGKLVRQSLEGGCKRMLVVGAGYDLVAFRCARDFPEVSCVELDHPATQKAKMGALDELPNLSFAPLDLVSQLPSATLPESDDKEPSVVVMEGLTMYFEKERVAGVLRDAAKLAGPRGKVIFTFMEKDEKGSIGFRGESSMIGKWLQARSESFRWGITREALPAFLESAGLGLNLVIDDRDLRHDHMQGPELKNQPLARGELICECSPFETT